MRSRSRARRSTRKIVQSSPAVHSDRYVPILPTREKICMVLYEANGMVPIVPLVLFQIQWKKFSILLFKANGIVPIVPGTTRSFSDSMEIGRLSNRTTAVA